MQNQPKARAAAVAIFVALTLLAAACGGSDDDVATSDDPAEVADTGDTSGGDSDNSDSGSDESSDDDPSDGDSGAGEDSGTTTTAPASNSNQRDCVRIAPADEAADTEAGVEEDVPLPPQEKPPVGEELLGSFDELIVTDLIVGTGAEAITGATIGMQYVGVLASDGTEFDASWNSGQPFVFDLGAGAVIQGWDEGIVGMKVGGRRILQIPAVQAYGDQARSEVIQANSDLIFIVDLIDVAAAPAPPPEIEEGMLGIVGELGITDLVEGDGCEARVGDILLVNYVGVNADDGVQFDSSFGGEPFRLTAGLSQVIDGWNEGIIGMKVGGERILQIPADAAYGDRDLVFRVHLEQLIDAPLAHTLKFEGDAPDDLEVTTLVEGDGDGAENGDFLEAHIAVIIHSTNTLAQSTWEQGQLQELALTEGAMLPGLDEGMQGIKAGELRQIIVPTDIAYPDGPPPTSGLESGDAIVFIVEVASITTG